MAQFALKAVIEARDKISGPLRRITSRLAPLRRAFSRVGASARNLTRNVGRVLRPLGLIGGAALGGLVLLTKRFVGSTDSLAKFLKQVEFAPSAFQRLQFAAGQSGLGPEEFRKTIEKLSKNVGDFKLGLTTLPNLLKNTSPEFLRQLKSTRSNAEAFDLVAKKIASMTDVQKKASIANAIFGRSGQKLLPLFASSAGEIAALNEQFFSLGGGLTGGALRAAEDTQDSFGRLSLSITSVKGAIFEKLLPVVTRLTDKFSFFIAANRQLISLRVNKTFESIATKVKGIDFGAIADSIKSVVGLVRSGIDFVGGFKNALIILAALQLAPLVASLIGVAVAAGTVASSIAVVTAATTGLSVALVATGIPIVIGLIAAGAFLIIKHWKPIKAFFFNLFENIKGIITSFAKGAFELVASPITAIKKALSFFGLGPKTKGIPGSIKITGPNAPARFGAPPRPPVAVKLPESVLRPKIPIKLPTFALPKLATPKTPAIAQARAAVTTSPLAARTPAVPNGLGAGRPLPSLQLGPPLSSPLAPQIQGPGESKVAIKVDIANAPAGTRVTTDADPGVDLTTDMGVRFGGGLG